MDQELAALLERARTVNPTEEELRESRIAIAAANGGYSDRRVTVDAVRASRTIVEAEANTK